MEIGRLGVWYPTDRLSPDELMAVAQRIETLGYDVLWHPESSGWEAFALGAFLLASTKRLKVGSAIANIYARDAVTARQGLKTLAATSGDRYILGLGVSHPPLVEGLRGHTYGKPLAAMRSYLEAMRGQEAACWSAERPVVIAALGPKMLALAASHTAGAIPYNVPPEHTRRARAALGSGKWLCVEQMICMESDPARARAAARKELARYLTLDNYVNNWLSLGFTRDDVANGASDRLIDAVIAWGDAVTVRRRVEEQFAAGADHVCIQPIAPDGSQTVDWAALEALAPGG